MKKFYIVKNNENLLGGKIPYKILNFLPANMFIPITKSPGIVIPLMPNNNLLYGPPIIKSSSMYNYYNENGIIKIENNNNTFILTVPFRYMRNIINDIYININDISNVPKISFNVTSPIYSSTIFTTPDRINLIVNYISTKYSDVSINKQMFKNSNIYTKGSVVIKEKFKSLKEKNNNIGGPEKNFSDIKAAGIVPYFIDSSGNCSFLLGYDPNSGLWKYFGGHKESIDNNSRETALREALEESCKISDPTYCYLPKELNIKLENGDGYCIPKLDSSDNKWNNFYFILIDKNNWISKMNTSEIDVSGQIKNNEVSKIKWFTEDEIRNLGSSLHNPLKSIFDNYNPMNYFLN